MALDRFGNYSRSVREGGRVRRVFFGKGPVAQMAALLDDERRCQRQARARAWRAEQPRWEAAAARQRALDDLGEMLARAALLAAGFYQHDRGAWRRRRMSGDSASNGAGLDPGVTHVNGAAMGPGCGCSLEGGPP